MGRKASKEPSKREIKLMRVAESFGEFASMCWAGFKLGGVK